MVSGVQGASTATATTTTAVQQMVCKGKDTQSNFDYEGTTFGLVGVLLVEVGLGAILIIFPKARNCVFAFLALVKIIRTARPIPETEPVAPQELAEPAAAVAPVRGNC